MCFVVYVLWFMCCGFFVCFGGVVVFLCVVCFLLEDLLTWSVTCDKGISDYESL